MTTAKMATHKRVASRSSSPQRAAAGAERSPIYGLNEDGVRNFLIERVKEQDNAMWTVTEKLLQMRDGQIYRANDRSMRLIKLVFSGTSGCGKTETVRWIKHLLGMDAGFEHESQYIEVTQPREEEEEEEGGECEQPQTMYPDIDTLVDRLNDALKFYSDGGDDHTNKRIRAYPRFMLLVVDEMDVMDASFLANLTPLLRAGCLTKSASKESFRLPAETALGIVFTCNYGETSMREMKTLGSDNEATLYICRDMAQRGMNEAVMKSLGRIVPFYPLKTETLRAILMERLDQFITESAICGQFGVITYDGDVKKLLVDKVINLTEQGRSVRQGLSKLLQKIGEFFTKALRELLKKKEVERDTLVVVLREIDLKKFDEQVEKECEQFVKDIMRSILSDPRATSAITEYRKRKENIDTLSMFMGQEKQFVAASEITQASYANQQNNVYAMCHGTSPLEVVHLQEKNQRLEDTLEKVESLVNKTKDGTVFHKKVKAIVVESKQRLSQYEESAMTFLDKPTPPSSSRGRLAIRGRGGRVEEMFGDESGEVDASPSATSSFEEEKPVPTVIERVLAKYADKNLEELEDITFSSEVDQDSEEDKQLARQLKERNDARLKKKLLKKDTHTMLRCTKCGVSKNAITAFNSRLYKSTKGKAPTISFRKTCNLCRKK